MVNNKMELIISKYFSISKAMTGKVSGVPKSFSGIVFCHMPNVDNHYNK